LQVHKVLREDKVPKEHKVHRVRKDLKVLREAKVLKEDKVLKVRKDHKVLREM
jgi:hypothetical protein